MFQGQHLSVEFPKPAYTEVTKHNKNNILWKLDTKVFWVATVQFWMRGDKKKERIFTELIHRIRFDSGINCSFMLQMLRTQILASVCCLLIAVSSLVDSRFLDQDEEAR